MRVFRALAPLAMGLCLASPASALNISGAAVPAVADADMSVEKVQFHGARVGRVGPAGVGRVGRPLGRPGGAVIVAPGRVGPGRVVVGRPGFRPVRPWVGPRVVVGRPWRGRYWRPGVGWAVGSIAAIGVVSAAAAAAWAPPPPDPDYCWYYSDPSMRSGFWAPCQ